MDTLEGRIEGIYSNTTGGLEPVLCLRVLVGNIIGTGHQNGFRLFDATTGNEVVHYLTASNILKLIHELVNWYCNVRREQEQSK